LSLWNQKVMWPEVWPGVSMNIGRQFADADLVAFAHGLVDQRILLASAFGATTRQIVIFFFSSAMRRCGRRGDASPGCRSASIRSPSAAASTGAASGASMAAVAPGFGVVDEHAVIVLQAGEQLGLGRHWESSSGFPETVHD